MHSGQSHPGDRGSWDALPRAGLVLQTNNWTPPSGHNNTQGSSCFQRETSQQSNQPALLVRFNLLPQPEGAERIKYNNRNNKTQRLRHSAAPLLQVGACVAETLLVRWRLSHWDGLCDVFYHHVKQERMVGAVLSEASGASSLLCNFWKVLGLNL